MPRNEGTIALRYPLPEKIQIAIDAGINMFELRRTRPGRWEQSDYGFWDVVVSERQLTGRIDVGYNVRWFQDNNNYIRYIPNSRNILTAFAPDDEYWHNRIMLAATINANAFTIQQLHSPGGVIPGSRVTKEILAIRDYMEEWKLVDPLQPKVEIFRSKNLEEIEAFTEEFAKRNNGRTPSSIPTKIVAIEKLMKKYPHAWERSSEFEHEHKVRIIEIIASTIGKEETPTPTITAGALLQQVAAMTAEERAELARLMYPALSVVTAPAAATAASSTDKKPSITDAEIEALSAKKLTSACKVRGIDVKKLTHDEMVAALKTHIAEETTVAPEVKPQAPTVANAPAGNPYEGHEAEEVVEP